MKEAFDPAPAAALLADCWRSGRLIAELPPAVRPATLARGYDVQEALVATLGHRTLGWKLGVGSTLQKRQNGIGRSIAGRILAPALHRPGDTVHWSGAGAATIEFEIAYILGRDMPADAPPGPPEHCIGEVRVAFEVVRSRFVDRRAVGWFSFAADLAGCHAVVLGEPIEAAELAQLARTLVVTADGEQRALALAGDDLTDPSGALSDLLAIARERGIDLPAGSIVSTGTLSKPFDLPAPGALIEARYGSGRLAFRLVSTGIGA